MHTDLCMSSGDVSVIYVDCILFMIIPVISIHTTIYAYVLNVSYKANEAKDLGPIQS